MLAVLDNVLEATPTPRVERLREAFMRLKPTASIDRAPIETRVMRETEGQHMVLRRSSVFAAVAAHQVEQHRLLPHPREPIYDIEIV